MVYMLIKKVGPHKYFGDRPLICMYQILSYQLILVSKDEGVVK